MAGLGSIQLGAYRKGLAGHLHDLVHDNRDVCLRSEDGVGKWWVGDRGSQWGIRREF